MNLIELSQWEDFIYQLETTDLVLGGTDGIANLQARLLANRTQFLFSQLFIQKQIAGVVEYNIDFSSTPVTLDATAIGKLHRFNLDAKIVCMLPDASSLPNGSLIHFSAYGLGFNHIKLRPQVAQIFDLGTYNDTEIIIYNKEKVTLIVNSGNWDVFKADGNFDFVGETSLQFKLSLNSLNTNGSLLNRDDVPRLWRFANSLNLDGSLILVNDGLWNTSDQYKSLFSTGNDATTFRIPDERGLFQRGLDLGRGLDFGRKYPFGAGSHEDDENKSHTHPVKPPNSNDQNGVGKTTTGNAAPEGSGIVTYNTEVSGGFEARPKNNAKISQIKF